MKDYLEETIETYETEADSFETSRRAFARVESMKRFESLLSGKAVLEIGCGPGRDARLLVDDGFNVTGIDISQSFIDIAQEQVPEATFYREDMRTMQLPSETYDGIWCSAVLLHLKREDMVPVLKKMYGTLKKGGAVFISLKQGDGEAITKDSRLNNRKRFFSFFAPDEVRGFIEQAGFSIIELAHTQFDDMRRECTWIHVFARK